MECEIYISEAKGVINLIRGGVTMTAHTAFSPRLEKLVPQTLDVLHNKVGQNMLSVLEVDTLSQAQLNAAVDKHIREVRPNWFMRIIDQLFSDGVKTAARTEAAVLDVIKQLKVAEAKNPALGNNNMGKEALLQSINKYVPALSIAQDLNVEDPSFLSILAGKILSDLTNMTVGSDRCAFIGQMGISSPSITRIADDKLNLSGTVSVDDVPVPFVIVDCKDDIFTLTYVGTNANDIVKPAWEEYEKARADYIKQNEHLQTLKDRLDAEVAKQEECERSAEVMLENLRLASYEEYFPPAEVTASDQDVMLSGSDNSVRFADENPVADEDILVQANMKEYNDICGTITQARQSVLSLTRDTLTSARNVAQCVELMRGCAKKAASITRPVYELCQNIQFDENIRRAFEDEGVNFIEEVANEQGQTVTLTRATMQASANHKVGIEKARSDIALSRVREDCATYERLVKAREGTIGLYSLHAGKLAESHLHFKQTRDDLYRNLSLMDEDLVICSQSTSLISDIVNRGSVAGASAIATIKSFAEANTSESKKTLLDSTVPVLVGCAKAHLTAVALLENIEGRMDGLNQRLSDVKSKSSAYIQSAKEYLDSLQYIKNNKDKVIFSTDAKNIYLSKINENILTRLEKAEKLNQSSGSLSEVCSIQKDTLNEKNKAILMMLDRGDVIPPSEMIPDKMLSDEIKSWRSESRLQAGQSAWSSYSRWDFLQNTKYDSRLNDMARDLLTNSQLIDDILTIEGESAITGTLIKDAIDLPLFDVDVKASQRQVKQHRGSIVSGQNESAYVNTSQRQVNQQSWNINKAADVNAPQRQVVNRHLRHLWQPEKIASGRIITSVREEKTTPARIQEALVDKNAATGEADIIAAGKRENPANN